MPAAPAPGPRTFILVVDREHIPNGEGQEMLAAAAGFVDTLRPDDRVALWTTSQINASIDFSEARDSIERRIRLSVGTYRPPAGPWNVTLKEALDADARAFGGTFTWVYTDGSTEQFPLSLKPIVERECYRQPDACPKQVQNQATEIAREARHLAEGELANLLALLIAITPLDGPKHIVLVTGGPVMTVENASTVQAIGAQAALARATVHALQIHDAGYQARTDQMRATAERVDQTESAAYALASATGGLAVTPVSGEAAFSRLSRELSASYLLAFEAETTDRDGRVHAIEVNVADRGWGGPPPQPTPPPPTGQPSPPTGGTSTSGTASRTTVLIQRLVPDVLKAEPLHTPRRFEWSTAVAGDRVRTKQKEIGAASSQAKLR